MKLIVLSKINIVGKDKREWVKLTALSEKGKIVEPFFSKSEYEAFKFPEAKFMQSQDIDSLFKDYQSLDISFDDNRRVESVS